VIELEIRLMKLFLFDNSMIDIQMKLKPKAFFSTKTFPHHNPFSALKLSISINVSQDKLSHRAQIDYGKFSSVAGRKEKLVEKGLKSKRQQIYS